MYGYSQRVAERCNCLEAAGGGTGVDLGYLMVLEQTDQRICLLPAVLIKRAFQIVVTESPAPGGRMSNQKDSHCSEKLTPPLHQHQCNH